MLYWRNAVNTIKYTDWKKAQMLISLQDIVARLKA